MADRIVVASAVDELPSDHVDKYIDGVFGDIQQEVLASPRLSSSDRIWFEREANNLRLKYKEILSAKNSRLKDAALRAVASALCLSYYYAVGSQAMREFRIDQTRSARERRERSGREFQAIVREGARKLWARNPEFVDNLRGTARSIYDAVAAEMDSMQNPPKWWKPTAGQQILGSQVFENAKQSLRAEINDLAKRRRIEAIRKCLSRMQPLDQ
jgi:hypothetical protein